MKKLRPLLLSIVWCLLVAGAYIALRSGWNIVMFWSDGFFIGGLSLLCFAILVKVASFGAFDIFAYQFSRKRPGDSFYEYMERKDKERKSKGTPSFPFILCTGLFFVGVAAVLLLFI